MTDTNDTKLRVFNSHSSHCFCGVNLHFFEVGQASSLSIHAKSRATADRLEACSTFYSFARTQLNVVPFRTDTFS